MYAAERLVSLAATSPNYIGSVENKQISSSVGCLVYVFGVVETL